MCKHHPQHCEVCGSEFRHVGCRSASCKYTIVYCPACDKSQAVRAMILDHEKDCPHLHAEVQVVRNAA